ncbi:RNA-binding proteins (RRM domain) [Methanosarcina horonobensis HB-1 = JCM 15518]|uniref:RNA-binding proteins (RRM domain) n=1 Tax=Methanosarcina horonobensis HB-1 = JCM 15518 TaxID=1434110 RepID=A0A0E3WU90_9EURY|nr:RNA-binding proteins (RRM domain) [Methanosarcina horonobensis HB-1 = JCM 15518]
MLAGNIINAYASSETSTDLDYSSGNRTEISDYTEIKEAEVPEDTGTGTSEDKYKEADTSGNAQNEPSDKDNPEYTETGSSEYKETEQEAEVAESNETESSEDEGSSDFTQTESSGDRKKGYSKHIRVERTEYRRVEDSRYTQPDTQEKTGSSKSAQQAPPSASVDLHGEKTEVILGEDILLKLSAVNLITKPTMNVQVILIPPSGTTVSSSEFVQSGAGQYTTTYELEPGKGRDIEVRIESAQVGDFNVKGRVVYYFGDDIENAEDYTLDLPIKVKEKSEPIESAMPGFGAAGLTVFGLLTVYLLKRD